MIKKRENLFKLQSDYQPSGDQPNAITSIVNHFENGDKFVTLLGVTGSGKTFTMANVIEKIQKKCLVLAPNKTLAAQLYSEFKQFFPHNTVEYFISYYDYYRPEAYLPGSDTYIEKDSAINEEIDKLRHSATKALLERDDVIVVSSVSCIYGIGSPVEYSDGRMKLVVGQDLKQEDFLFELIHRQFQRSFEGALERGFFKVQGDVVELIPSYEDDLILRIEFFDGVVDRLFFYDPLKKMNHGYLSETMIYPRSHYMVGKEKLKLALKSIQEELRLRINELEQIGKYLEANRLAQRTMLDLEMLEEIGFCSGVENYSRHLNQSAPGSPPPTLIDYFGDDFLLFIDESHLTIPQVGGMYAGDRSRKMTLVEHGFRLPSALDNRPLNFLEFEERYKSVLFVSATPGDYELEKTNGEFVEQVIRPTGLLDPLIEVREAHTQVADILNESRKVIAKNQRVLITTLTKKLSEELTVYFTNNQMRIRYLHSDIDALERVEILKALRKGEFDILVGINLLREGLDLPEVALVAILDADKEGFLRSKRSLIQTMGRAARNLEGRVIMYAYKMTSSMEQAIQETDRRRAIQSKYNADHGKVPRSLGSKSHETFFSGSEGPNRILEENDQEMMSNEELDQSITKLKLEMKNCSDALNFEHALVIRDKIKKLSQMRLMN